MASWMRLAVVKSGRRRFRTSSPSSRSWAGDARSTVAPFGTRPTVGTLTVTLLAPSSEDAPKPPTVRLPWAMA